MSGKIKTASPQNHVESAPGDVRNGFGVIHSSADAAGHPEDSSGFRSAASTTPVPLVSSVAISSDSIHATTAEGTQRVDMSALTAQLAAEMGVERWHQYRETLSRFLLGKLSRTELIDDLEQLIGRKNFRYHNLVLLSILANACRELPASESAALAGWSRDAQTGTGSLSSASIESLSREILSLSVKDRRRLKSIPQNAASAAGFTPPSAQAQSDDSKDGKRAKIDPKTGKPEVNGTAAASAVASNSTASSTAAGESRIKASILPPLPSIVATRQALLPRIPYSDESQQISSQDGSSPATPTLPPGSAGGPQQNIGSAITGPNATLQTPPKGRKRRASALSPEDGAEGGTDAKGQVSSTASRAQMQAQAQAYAQKDSQLRSEIQARTGLSSDEAQRLLLRQQQQRQQQLQQRQRMRPGQLDQAGGESSIGSGQGRVSSPSGASSLSGSGAAIEAGTSRERSGSQVVNEYGFVVHPGRSSGPLTWTQDVIHGLDVPLSSETYEMPSDEAICTRMLGVALENGLVDGIEVGTTDIMFSGLEMYISELVTRMLQNVKYRTVSSAQPLCARDLDMFANTRPTELQEISGPLYRLRAEFLNDEATVLPAKRTRYSPVSEPLTLLNSGIGAGGLAESVQNSSSGCPVSDHSSSDHPISGNQVSGYSAEPALTDEGKNGSINAITMDGSVQEGDTQEIPTQNGIKDKSLGAEAALEQHNGGVSVICQLLDFSS